MHNIITSSILTIASLLIILLGAVDAQGSCCYSISSELKQEPNLYLLNFTASHVNSKRNNNDYIARIGFPKGNLIQGEPSSPFSYVRCIKKPESGERPVYECESKDRELFFVQFMVQLPQTSQTSQTPPQTSQAQTSPQTSQTQTLPQTSQTQSSDTSQTTQLVPSDTTQSTPSDTLQPSPTDTLLSLQANIQSKNDTASLTDTRVFIFGDKCEQRSFCIDLAASNDEQNSDKISLGPLGTWPKYAVITGGCILGLALVVALYLVYRRNAGYKYGEGGGGSYTRSGRNNSMFSPNSLLGSGGGRDGEDNYNYKPKNTLINIDDEDNNNNINRSSSMNYSNRSSGINNNDRSNRLSKHNKPHRESRIKQLESYIDEDEVVERRIDFNEKDAYDPFSSVDIELDKDTLSRLTKNDSYHHGNSNRSSKSRSNRSGNEHSDEKDQSDLSDSDIQPKKRSSNDREDQRTERSRSKKQIHHSLSSKNNNDDHDSESHRGISTSIHSLRGKEYASSSDLTDKSNSDSNNREIPKSRRRKNKVNDRDRKRNSDSEESSSSDTPLGDKMPLAILATRSQSKTSLSNQSEKLRKEQKSEDGREDDDEKPLGQISKATNLDDEGNNDVGTKL